MEAFGFLPKEIMDMIGEYNVEHRPKMKQVMEELEHANEMNLLPFIDNSYKCDNAYCSGIMMTDDNDFIRTKVLGFWFKFCCGECEYDNHRDIRRHYASHPWDIKYKSMLKFGEITA